MRRCTLGVALLRGLSLAAGGLGGHAHAATDRVGSDAALGDLVLRGGLPGRRLGDPDALERAGPGFPAAAASELQEGARGDSSLGLCLVVVLTMIAGARELLTPGAWQRRGPLYAVADPQPPDANPPPQADPPQTADRKEHLERLRDALWQFAAKHGGQFPSADDKAIPGEAWEVPGGVGTRYLYVPGLAVDKPSTPLAYEPAIHGDERVHPLDQRPGRARLLGRTPPPPGRGEGEEAVSQTARWIVRLVVAFLMFFLLLVTWWLLAIPIAILYAWIACPVRTPTGPRSGVVERIFKLLIRLAVAFVLLVLGPGSLVLLIGPILYPRGPCRRCPSSRQPSPSLAWPWSS